MPPPTRLLVCMGRLEARSSARPSGAQALVRPSFLQSAFQSQSCSSGVVQARAAVRQQLLQAVVEDSVGRGEAAGAAAVLFQAMAAAEEQARAGADE